MRSPGRPELSAPGRTVAVMAADSPPYHRCDPPVPVLVHVGGQDLPGIVEGWRGDRVKVEWNAGVGLKHSGWLPASSVTRTEP
jgi:hypothetical protein